MTDTETDADDGDEIAVEVPDDPESITQQRRLNDIFEARRQVRQQRLRTKEYRIEGNSTDQFKATQLYRAAVENYLSEIRSLLLSDELGKQYWYQVDFGEIVLEPPFSVEEIGRNRGQDRIYRETRNGNTKTYRVTEQVEPAKYDLQGLRCPFALPNPVAHTFTFQAKRYGVGGGGVQKSHTAETALPFDTLDDIVNTANEYLSERGLDLELSEIDTTAEADYSDIL